MVSTMHAPDRPKMFTVFVDGERWREIASFQDATRTDTVYLVDSTGTVVFGDGERGQLPRPGAEVIVTYGEGGGDPGNVQVSAAIAWPPRSFQVLVAVDGNGVHIQTIDPGAERLSGEKRVRYFSGEMLSAEDFAAEQQYHQRARWRHNKVLHGPGIVTGLGLEVSSGDATPSVTIKPGYAIDSEGHELILDSCVELEIGESNTSYYVTIEHTEKQTDWRPTQDGSELRASRIEDGVLIRLAIDHEKSQSLTIGKIVHGSGGWGLDGMFQLLRSN